MRDMKANSFDAYFHLAYLLISATVCYRHRKCRDLIKTKYAHKTTIPHLSDHPQRVETNAPANVKVEHRPDSLVTIVSYATSVAIIGTKCNGFKSYLRSSSICALVNSPGLVCAAISDSSPHSTVAAQSTARRRALSPGARSVRQPIFSKCSPTTSLSLPLPTVPTIRLGRVQAKYNESRRTSQCTMPCDCLLYTSPSPRD